MPKRKRESSEGLSTEEIACLNACSEPEEVSSIMQSIIEHSRDDLFIQALKFLEKNPAKQLEYIALATTYEFSQEEFQEKKQGLVSAALNDEEIFACLATWESPPTSLKFLEKFDSIMQYLIENSQTQFLVKFLTALENPVAQDRYIESLISFFKKDDEDEECDEDFYEIIEDIITTSQPNIFLKILKRIESDELKLKLIMLAVRLINPQASSIKEIILQVFLDEQLPLSADILLRIDLELACSVINNGIYANISSIKQQLLKDVLKQRITEFNHLCFSGDIETSGIPAANIDFLKKLLPAGHSFRKVIKENDLYSLSPKNAAGKDSLIKIIFLVSGNPENEDYHISGLAIHNDLLCFCNRGMLNFGEDEVSGLKFYQINGGCTDLIVEKLEKLKGAMLFSKECFDLLDTLKEEKLICQTPIYTLPQKPQSRGNCTIATIKSTMLAFHIFSEDPSLSVANIQTKLAGNPKPPSLVGYMRWYKKLTFDFRLKAFNEFLAKYLNILVLNDNEMLLKNANVFYMFAIKVRYMLQNQHDITAEIIEKTLANIQAARAILKARPLMLEQILDNLSQVEFMLNQKKAPNTPLAFDFAQLCIYRKLDAMFKEPAYLQDFMYSVGHYRDFFIKFINCNKNKKLAVILDKISSNFDHLVDSSSLETQLYLTNLFIVFGRMPLKEQPSDESLVDNPKSDESLVDKSKRDEILKKILSKLSPTSISTLKENFNSDATLSDENTEILKIINSNSGAQGPSTQPLT